MSPGEIYWVDLPGANGHEQRGRRPGIVLQDEQSVGELPVVIVIPLTTSRAALRFRGTTTIAAPPESGLGHDRSHWCFRCELSTGNGFGTDLEKSASTSLRQFIQSWTE